MNEIDYEDVFTEIKELKKLVHSYDNGTYKSRKMQHRTKNNLQKFNKKQFKEKLPNKIDQKHELIVSELLFQNLITKKIFEKWKKHLLFKLLREKRNQKSQGMYSDEIDLNSSDRHSMSTDSNLIFTQQIEFSDEDDFYKIPLRISKKK